MLLGFLASYAGSLFLSSYYIAGGVLPNASVPYLCSLRNVDYTNFQKGLRRSIAEWLNVSLIRKLGRLNTKDRRFFISFGLE